MSLAFTLYFWDTYRSKH